MGVDLFGAAGNARWWSFTSSFQ